ncbi:hypothetical protein I350_00350 [Cryptococcus amylolentus CBS 6273]|uniref:non-specific serine/threonine protein kinase n=1 Tax=Cryptococcus amylolentus CBS 6273 TaxID=1296118 RepID=A0A1E3KER0_9TREE|nr:hypothetical protein I350_00350 [Cryptococcus amylolentus CBS 6273]
MLPTPLLFSLLAFLALLLSVVASSEPAALIPFPQYTRRPAQPSPTQAPQVVINHDVHPLVLVSTVDGALHAIDRQTGTEKWVLDEGDPLVGGKMRGRDDEKYIVEPLSGSLYVHEEIEGEVKMRQLPLGVEQLIALSPFAFPDAPTQIFTGSKQTSLMSINLLTGEQVDCFPSAALNLSHHSAAVCENDELDDLERANALPVRDTLFVGRTDYRLTIHSPTPSAQGLSTYTSTVYSSSEKKGGPGVQEIKYSTYTPNSYNRPLADTWLKASVDHQSWGPDREEPRTRVELGFDGKALGVKPGAGIVWNKELGNVGIGVYEILLPRDSPHGAPVLVPQPPAHLPALFPEHGDARAFNIHRAPPSTYIATLPEHLALPTPQTNLTASDGKSVGDALHFALSSSSYPLINFARPARPGHLSDGLFFLAEDGESSAEAHKSMLPFLIDAPKEHELIDGPANVKTLEAGGIRQKVERTWWKWVLLFGMAVTILGAGIVNFVRHRGGSVGVGEVDEKTRLLVVNEDQTKTEEVIPSITIQESTPSPAVPPAALPPTDTQPLAPPQKAGKKSTRRRVRGKKKRRDSNPILEEGEEGEFDEDGDGRESGRSSKTGDKPLPDLPRELSSTDLLDYQDKERLAISDQIIGESFLSIGFGSHGTVVLKGTWGGRPVAVKRLLSDFTRLASQEVKLLQASDDHPNVIRYYCQEKRDNFLYIALDLCQASLADLIESPEKHKELAAQLDRKKALMEVTRGVKHLHGMKIIHRDIKPQNVLVSQTPSGLRILVSDFGLARRLDQDQSSFAPTANNLAGSLGWRAPECIRGVVRLNEGFDQTASGTSSGGTVTAEGEACSSSRSRLTKAVDLFALGCLYFWVLLSGEHPFGETYNRESNIVKGEAVNIDMLDILGEEREEAKDLIGRMLSMEPGERPETAECLTHPLFWAAGKRLAFLCDASDRFEIILDPTDPSHPEYALHLLEDTAQQVVGKDWYSRLDKVFTSSLGKYRKYKGGSVRDLLRALRNKKHHYQDLDAHTQAHMGSLPSGFLLYFTSRYPRLVMHVYGAIRDSGLGGESMFEGYFADP